MADFRKFHAKSFASNWPDSEEGWYATGLVLKLEQLPLTANKEGSLHRLHVQVFKLRSIKKLSGCDEIIHDQLNEDAVESTAYPESATCPFELSSGKLYSLLRCV